ncbi:hypothetical protein BFR04_00545 [Gaetbulibacter sp. 4G1]|nr:T9SS type A sorting domain-containing protein [Gaetbulibacter sp. 4G1]PIA79374.1 hypothetical protein BFR04_00545 [Gaetbulibacter sp. 4G1]
MKQHYKFLQQIVLLFSIVAVTSISAQNIQFTFANAQNTNDGTNDFYEADIMIQTIGGLADFKLGSGQLYFNYNTAAFGTNVRASNKIEITASPSPDYFLGEKIGFTDFYDISVINDNTSSRVSWAFQQGVSSGAMTQLVGSTPRKLIHLKLEYADVSQSPNIGFEDNETLVNSARDQFYTACGPYNTASTTLDCDINDLEPLNKNIQFLDAMYDSSGAALGTLGTDNVELAGVSVFPNPVKDIVTIKGLEQELSRLEVYNMTGQLVSTKIKNLEFVNVKSLSEGVYFLKLNTAKSSKIIKFIKN